jgi:hypothetical protein
MSSRSRNIMLPGSRARPVRRADKPEPIVRTMWEGSSTSHSPTGLHGLMRGWLHSSALTCCCRRWPLYATVTRGGSQGLHSGLGTQAVVTLADFRVCASVPPSWGHGPDKFSCPHLAQGPSYSTAPPPPQCSRIVPLVVHLSSQRLPFFAGQSAQKRYPHSRLL